MSLSNVFLEKGRKTYYPHQSFERVLLGRFVFGSAVIGFIHMKEYKTFV